MTALAGTHRVDAGRPPKGDPGWIWPPVHLLRRFEAELPRLMLARRGTAQRLEEVKGQGQSFKDVVRDLVNELASRDADIEGCRRVIAGLRNPSCPHWAAADYARVGAARCCCPGGYHAASG